MPHFDLHLLYGSRRENVEEVSYEDTPARGEIVSEYVWFFKSFAAAKFGARLRDRCSFKCVLKQCLIKGTV